MTAIRDALNELGITKSLEQVAVLRLIHYFSENKETLPWGNNSFACKKSTLGLWQAIELLKNESLFPNKSAVIEWLHDITQELFYNPVDYRALQNSSFNKDSTLVKELLSTAGHTSEILPSHGHYDFLLVPGGSQPFMEPRMDYIRDFLSANQIDIKQIIFLGSIRLLMPELEQEYLEKILLNKVKDAQLNHSAEDIKRIVNAAVEDSTSLDIKDIYARGVAQAKFILQELGLVLEKWPTEADMLKIMGEELQSEVKDLNVNISIHTLCSPMIRKADKQGKKIKEEPVWENNADNIQELLFGRIRRANTKDTFRDFAESEIAREGGSVLCISNQPLIRHQSGQLLAELPEERFPMPETIGPAVEIEDMNLHHALGSLAKGMDAMYRKWQKAEEKEHGKTSDRSTCPQR